MRLRLQNPFTIAALFVALLGAVPAGAQTSTRTYDLEDVWLLPDVSHPGQAAQQMTGTFEWTWVPGDFENGTGELLTVGIPWYGTDVAGLDVTFDVDSIEMSLAANVHDHGLDITLRLLQDLSPDSPSAIDPVLSSFDVEVGISHTGHVISGSVVPRALFTEYCGPADANSSGAPGVAGAQGSNRVADNDVVLQATSLPVDQFGYFLASRTQGFVEHPGGSMGNLCLGGSILRFVRPGEVGFSGPLGEFSLALDLTDFPTLPASAVLPGEEWNFQAWFRDVDPGPTSNFTQGITVRFE